MNTYYMHRYIQVKQEVAVEAMDEDEAYAKADVEDWIEENREEVDWESWEVDDIERDKDDYEAHITLSIVASSQDVAEQAASYVKDLIGKTETDGDDEAEIVDATIDSVNLY